MRIEFKGPLKILLLALVSILTFSAVGLTLNVGDKAPALSVTSGDDKVMTLDMLRGKVVVLLYTTKDTSYRNAKLRETLNNFYDTQSDERKYHSFKFVILDCSSAFFPIDFIWKKKLIEASKSKNMDIYGDWDGKVAEDYDFNLDDSNIVIIDKDGFIRYLSRKEITDKNEINKIERLLNQIT